jgi:hypothetical protein
LSEPCSPDRAFLCRAKASSLEDLVYTLVKAEQAAISGDREWVKRNLEYAKVHLGEAVKEGMIKGLHERLLKDYVEVAEKHVDDPAKVLSNVFLAHDTARRALYEFFTECVCGK